VVVVVVLHLETPAPLALELLAKEIQDKAAWQAQEHQVEEEVPVLRVGLVPMSMAMAVQVELVLKLLFLELQHFMLVAVAVVPLVRQHLL
jgi:hypothetical protein